MQRALARALLAVGASVDALRLYQKSARRELKLARDALLLRHARGWKTSGVGDERRRRGGGGAAAAAARWRGGGTAAANPRTRRLKVGLACASAAAFPPLPTAVSCATHLLHLEPSSSGTLSLVSEAVAPVDRAAPTAALADRRKSVSSPAPW